MSVRFLLMPVLAARRDAQRYFVQLMKLMEHADGANSRFVGWHCAPALFGAHPHRLAVGSLIGWLAEVCCSLLLDIGSDEAAQQQILADAADGEWGLLQQAAWSWLRLQLFTLQCCASQGRTRPPTCCKLQAVDLLCFAGILGKLT